MEAPLQCANFLGKKTAGCSGPPLYSTYISKTNLFKLHPRRETEGPRSAQVRRNCVELEWRIERNRVVVLVGQIRAPRLDRPGLIQRADPDARIQQAEARLNLARVEIRSRVVR